MPMITPEAFNAKYKTEFVPAIYADWIAIAETRAAIFPSQYRALAAEYYIGFFMCTLAGERQGSEIKQFEVKPEGYSVTYDTSGTGRCDRWLQFLKQLGLTAGVEVPELKTSGPAYADRTEKFRFNF
jgi:hypothetical protein